MKGLGLGVVSSPGFGFFGVKTMVLKTCVAVAVALVVSGAALAKDLDLRSASTLALVEAVDLAAPAHGLSVVVADGEHARAHFASGRWGVGAASGNGVTVLSASARLNDHFRVTLAGSGREEVLSVRATAPAFTNISELGDGASRRFGFASGDWMLQPVLTASVFDGGRLHWRAGAVGTYALTDRVVVFADLGIASYANSARLGVDVWLHESWALTVEGRYIDAAVRGSDGLLRAEDGSVRGFVGVRYHF